MQLLTEGGLYLTRWGRRELNSLLICKSFKMLCRHPETFNDFIGFIKNKPNKQNETEKQRLVFHSVSSKCEKQKPQAGTVERVFKATRVQ